MKTKKIFMALLLPVISVVLIAAFGVFYAADVRTSIWNQSVSDICEMTKQGGHSFDIYISRDTEMLHYMAQNFSQTSSEDEAEIVRDITSLDGLDSDYFVINLERGVLYSNHSDTAVELSGTELNKYASYKGSVINEPSISRFTGVQVLSCFENFRFADGTRGIVQSEHPVASIAEEFSLSFYNGSGYSDIINSDGKILIRSNNVNNNRTFNNIFDIIDLNGNSREDLQIFKDALAADKSGAAHFRYRNEDYVYSFAPLNSIDSWYIISIIPNSAITKHAGSVIMTPKIIIALIALCVLLMCEFAFIIVYYRRKLNKYTRELRRYEEMFDLLSENTDTVFLLVNCPDFSVDYISKNVERVFGIPAKTIKNNPTLLNPTNYTSENYADYETILRIQPGTHETIKNTRVNGITGDVLSCDDTIYRFESNSSDKLIIVIDSKKKE